MLRSRLLAVALIIAGVIANNYVFMHDVFWNKYEGWAIFGWKTYLVAAVGLAAVIVGAILLFGANGRRKA